MAKEVAGLIKLQIKGGTARSMGITVKGDFPGK